MKWIGLTGGIASGKSTVAGMLREMGAPVIDADKLAHQALHFYAEQLATEFGEEILNPDGHVNRKKLGAKIFSSPESKKKLEDLIHPFVRKEVKKKRKEWADQGHSFAIYDVPLLFEKNLEDQFDQVVLVYAPLELSIKRLMKRNNLSHKEAILRLSNQMDIEEKKHKADVVIDNQGSLDQLSEKVIAWQQTL